MSDEGSLQYLSEKLSSPSTDDEKASAALEELAGAHTLPGPGDHSPPTLSPEPHHPDEREGFDQLLEQHNLTKALFAAYQKRLDSVSKRQEAKDHVLDALPCAHVVAGEAWSCPNTSGLSVCSKCRLVAYCSKECQVAHWKLQPSGHKGDCKDPIRSESWLPAWVEERRPPSFSVVSNTGSWAKSIHPLGLGKSLWGNVPAVDVINLSKNEAVSGANLSVAFVASGDLRNVVKTVNSLPEDYRGELTILLNDRDPYVVLRNFALLHLLGSVTDQRRAADVALHFWYSSFIPEGYDFQVRSSFAALVQGHDSDGFDFPLGGGASSLSGVVSTAVWRLLVATQTSMYTLQDANEEIGRVRFAESRADRHHRLYCRLEPSHRLSHLEFRRFGLVLPFGAPNNWFNSPNRSLFSPEGRIVQSDLDNPLDSWDPVAVVEAGRLHGVPRADLYGCLYFYLSDQLREFHARLSRFHIKFKLFGMDTVALSSSIRSGSLSKFGVPASMRFDRIDASNVVDAQYVGLEKVLKTWGGLLSKSPHATMVAYFMNWAAENDGARPGLGGDVLGKMLDRMEAEGKLPLKKVAQKLGQDAAFALVTASHHTFTALFDNSPAFAAFLSSLRIQPVLENMGLKLKENHTISPHRYYAPLGAPPSALPVFPDAETWYLRTNVGAPLWSERYIEICRT